MTDVMENSERGKVSVVLVDYRGAADTITAVEALRELSWPSDLLQVIVVDNAPGAGSGALIKAACPEVQLIEAGANLGFAGGCNLGVEHATGEFIAFLNNDARPHPEWLSAATRVLNRERTVVCVASKVLDWEGTHVDFVDGSLTWFGMGYKREAERPDSVEYDEPKNVLFATGSAMIVRADVYREVGGFDDRFFMFYEDVDLGWRLNLLGYQVRYVPDSIVYHKHHASMKAFGNFREEYLLERNALLSMYKNYSDETLATVFPAALALAIRRSVARAGVDARMLDLAVSPGGDDVPDVTVPKSLLTAPFAVDYFVEMLPSLQRDREVLQATRRRSDRDMFSLFRQALEPAYPLPSYLKAHADLVAAFDIEKHFSTRHRVLVVTGEPLKPQMAGPAIRALEMARHLATEHDVVLGTLTTVADLSHPDFKVTAIGARQMHELEQWCDVIIFQGFLLESFPWLRTSNKIIIADIYDPMHLEQLEQAKDQSVEGRAHSVHAVTGALNTQLARADFLLCASDKQRDFWLGQLASVGRINPANYDEDESLGSLISVVPFGLPDQPPVQRRHAIKGAVPGISADDKVILWGGGIYNWFDPLTLIRAMAVLSQDHPDVRLFFLGVKHPNPGVPDMRMAWEARRLAEAKGLLNKIVFFNEGWVPYDQRQDYLLDADLGVSCHLDHIETAFSFRTRILDYLWAGLPVVATAGDTFAAIIEERGLGRTVPAEDVTALVLALEEILYGGGDLAARAAVADFAPEFTWTASLQPLIEFCRTPRRAPDLHNGSAVVPVAQPFMLKPPTWRDDVSLARQYLAEGGIREVVSRAFGRIRRLVRARLTG